MDGTVTTHTSVFLYNNISNVSATSQLPMSLIDTLPVAVYTCDQLGYITTFNKAAVRLWGREPVLGTDLWCGSWKIFQLDGQTLPLDTCPMARTLKERVPIEGEEIIVERPDGTRRNVLPYPVPLFNAMGELTGAINTLVDITEQRRNEARQAMLAAIIESSDDAIISKTLDGIITSWNEAAEKMFGYTEAEAVGKHITLIIPKNRLEEEKVIINKIRSSEKIDHFETYRKTKAGNEIPISLTVSPIKSNSGHIIGASKIARDISSQKAAEEAQQHYAENLEALYEEIKILNARKDEFIGIASHELKTPLTSISGYLQLLERSLTNDTHIGFVRKTKTQMNKLLALVSDLLDVSKIQAGKLELNKETFNLFSLLAETIEIVQPLNNTHKLVLASDLMDIKLTADKQRMEQVIINLLTNAVKYSPGSKQVDVTIKRGNKQVTVIVKDYGIGISKEQEKMIFARFFRAEGLAPHMSGLGLGLYIAREIVERHKGTIGVRSETGEGSEFYFSIPFSDK